MTCLTTTFARLLLISQFVGLVLGSLPLPTADEWHRTILSVRFLLLAVEVWTDRLESRLHTCAA